MIPLLIPPIPDYNDWYEYDKQEQIEIIRQDMILNAVPLRELRKTTDTQQEEEQCDRCKQ